MFSVLSSKVVENVAVVGEITKTKELESGLWKCIDSLAAYPNPSTEKRLYLHVHGFNPVLLGWGRHPHIRFFLMVPPRGFAPPPIITSESQCNSKFTMRSRFTTRRIFSTAGSFGVVVP